LASFHDAALQNHTAAAMEFNLLWLRLQPPAARRRQQVLGTVVPPGARGQGAGPGGVENLVLGVGEGGAELDEPFAPGAGPRRGIASATPNRPGGRAAAAAAAQEGAPFCQPDRYNGPWNFKEGRKMQPSGTPRRECPVGVNPYQVLVGDERIRVTSLEE
jgi:hypothetical protein